MDMTRQIYMEIIMEIKTENGIKIWTIEFQMELRLIKINYLLFICV